MNIFLNFNFDLISVAGCHSSRCKYWNLYLSAPNVSTNLLSMPKHCIEVIGTKYCQHIIISFTWFGQCEYGHHRR